MKLQPVIGALAASVCLAGPACAAITVIGDTSATACSQAALHALSDDDSLRSCDDAIGEGFLNKHDLTGTYINRGVVHMNRHEYAAARGDFERAIQVDPAVGEGWIDRGAINIIEHHFKEGIADTTKGLDLGVKEPEKGYFNRAVAYEGVDDEKSAYLDYQQALALKPDWDEPKHELLRFTVTRRAGPVG